MRNNTKNCIILEKYHTTLILPTGIVNKIMNDYNGIWFDGYMTL